MICAASETMRELVTREGGADEAEFAAALVARGVLCAACAEDCAADLFAWAAKLLGVAA